MVWPFTRRPRSRILPMSEDDQAFWAWRAEQANPAPQFSSAHPWRRLRRCWLVFTERLAREAGIYRLLDWLAERLER